MTFQHLCCCFVTIKNESGSLSALILPLFSSIFVFCHLRVDKNWILVFEPHVWHHVKVIITNGNKTRKCTFLFKNRPVLAKKSDKMRCWAISLWHLDTSASPSCLSDKSATWHRWARGEGAGPELSPGGFQNAITSQCETAAPQLTKPEADRQRCCLGETVVGGAITQGNGPTAPCAPLTKEGINCERACPAGKTGEVRVSEVKRDTLLKPPR